MKFKLIYLIFALEIFLEHIYFRINHGKIRLILGDHDRRHNEAHQELRFIEKVSSIKSDYIIFFQVFINPHFVKKTFNNDIALIKMKSKVSSFKSN